MGGIYIKGIGIPGILVIVYMCDEQAMPRKMGVMSCLLTVFQHEILVAVAVVVEHIRLGGIGQRLHAFHRLWTGQFHRLQPAAHPSLIGREATGHTFVSVVASPGHYIPIG